MAVYTTYTVKPQYYSGAISGCLNGGEDYRTLNAEQIIQDINLAVDTGFTGLSKACKITSISMPCQYKVLNTSNGTGLGTIKGALWYEFIRIDNPSYSGNSLNLSGNYPINSTLISDWVTVSSEFSTNKNYSSHSGPSVSLNDSQGAINGNTLFIGARFWFESKNSTVKCRLFLNNVSFSITRTRACYITFTNLTPGKDDSYTQQFDYGVVPVKNVTATGYIFKGWKASNGTVYTTLPAAGEVDVTYTAVWVLDRINKILVDTSQSSGVLSDTAEADKIYADMSKVYG